MIFAKYSFTDKDTWDQVKQLISQDGVFIGCDIQEDILVCQEKDEQGVCITPRPGYHVDIQWYGEIPQEFNTYEVFPDPIGNHTFFGNDSYYLARFCQFNPESPFCSSN